MQISYSIPPAIKAVFMHSLEVCIATSLPFVLDWVANAGVSNHKLAVLSAVLVVLAKTAREVGWLPDYVAQS